MKHRVVIIGGGFGGMNAAKRLGRTDFEVTLIDKRNFHLFQPLLYQVAIGGLSPGDIAHPLRAVVRHSKNVAVLKAEAIDFDPIDRKIILLDGEVPYDSLIVATGSSHHYFGNEQWAEKAPGLKTIEDALEIRRRIFLALEAAEREPDPTKRRAWLTFVVVGGGPTGVELAGSLAELARTTVNEDFRHLSSADTKIILLEALDRVLPPYPEDLSAKAQRSLEKLGVEVQTGTMVTDIQDGVVRVRRGKDKPEEAIPTQTVLWGAGIKASPWGKILAEKTGAETNKAGKVLVEPDLSLRTQPNIFVIGDLAALNDEKGEPLPGLAAVAIQQGRYVAETLVNRVKGRRVEPFKYRDKGTMAIIGRNSAVADANGFHISGFVAWLAWIFVHIYYLIGFDNKVSVLFQWGWNYFTFNRGAQLITNEETFRLVGAEANTGIAGRDGREPGLGDSAGQPQRHREEEKVASAVPSAE